MRLSSRLLALPAPMLALLCLHTASADPTQAHEEAPTQWPWTLPKHVKYWPEDPPNRRRDLEAIEEHVRLGRSPVGVMKMSVDEEEKFYMEYWQFEGDLSQARLGETSRLRAREEEGLPANISTRLDFRPPFALHTDQHGQEEWEDLRVRRVVEGRNSAAALALLKRGFLCPTGTVDCSAIGHPNSCCATSETCFPIQDTGLGPVGCCPTGGSCGGIITNCDAPNTACPANLGGGCCIPNFVCAGVGCVINPSLIVTILVTQTFTVFSTPRTTVITSTSTSTPPTSALQTTLVCSSGFQACPIGIGGGCCATDRVCSSLSCALPPGSSSSTSATSIVTTPSATGVPPVRPTSAASSTTTSPVPTGTSCPTGFYGCSAVYQGGCCRTGRNCDTTSCPATSSMTIISQTETIVVPVGPAATVTSPSGACATGWASCAPSDGGNCCPSGWACGTASCLSVGPTSTALVQKGSPSLGVRNGIEGLGAVIVAFGIGLALL